MGAGHLGLPVTSAGPNAAQMAATMAAMRGPGIPQPTASTAAQPHLAQSSVGYRPQLGFTDAQQQQAVLAAASAAASQAPTMDSHSVHPNYAPPQHQPNYQSQQHAAFQYPPTSTIQQQVIQQPQQHPTYNPYAAHDALAHQQQGQ